MLFRSVPTSCTFKFYVGTTLAYTITSTGGSGTSDERLKTDVEPITNALARIEQLQGKTFFMNGDTSQRQMGFVAQEVLPVCPEVVTVLPDDEAYSPGLQLLQYEKLTALLCEGIKELAGEVRSLKSRIAALENP